MLSVMRKHAASWFIKILLGSIVLVFVFWGVGSFGSRRLDRAAVVNGEIITRPDYDRARKNLEDAFRDYYKDKFDPKLMESLNLPREAMERLVEQALLCQKAREMGLVVTQEELRRAIATQMGRDGQLDRRVYERFLANNRWRAEEYEAYLEKSLLAEKLKSFIQSEAKLPESEARLFYDFLHKQISIAYAAFEPGAYTGVTATEKEVEDHYKARQEDYRIEPLVQADYVFVPFEGTADPAAVSEDEVKEYYNANAAEFQQEKTVEASHILVRLAPDAPADKVEEARKKAQELADKARAGEDFAELANKNSEGPSAERGGFLGAFKKSQMVPAFSEKAFSMAAGEISDPVRTDFGFHVIKVQKINEAVTRTIEEAGPEIRQKLAAEASRGRAYDRINKLFDDSLSSASLADAAVAAKAELKTTEFFGARGPAAIPGSQKVADATRELKPGDYTDVLELPTGYGLFQVKEQKASRLPELAEVRDKVAKDATYEKRKAAAKESASAFLAEVSAGGKIEDLAAKKGISVKRTEFFERGGQIPGLGFSPDVIQAAFDLSAADPWPKEPVESAGSYFVIQWLSQKDADPAKFSEEKEEILTRLAERKKEEAVKGWLDALRGKAVIEMNQDLLPQS